MSVSRYLIAVLGALSVTALATLPAVAQDSAGASTGGSRSQSPSQPIDEIEVRGRRMDEIEFDLHRFVMDFVLEVTAMPPGRGLARWQRSVCVGVHNLENTAAQYLVDRISLLAVEVGLEPGEPGCTPQVMIVFTTDADEVATRMVEQDRRLFRPVAGLAGTNLDLEALDAFMRSDKPVRWWHVSMPVDARTGLPAIQTSVADGPPTIAVAGPSRIYSGVRDDLQRVIIIADAGKLAGMTWQQLGDYLAVISLAQVDPKANPSAFDSILNLFSTPQYYSGLTDWDRSYVRALYEFQQERDPRLQRGGLVSQMTNRERAADAQATAD
jgi:hypothetical protein